jgi:hypothetical protein
MNIWNTNVQSLHDYVFHSLPRKLKPYFTFKEIPCRDKYDFLTKVCGQI